MVAEIVALKALTVAAILWAEINTRPVVQIKVEKHKIFYVMKEVE